jgi:hypothetical protein
MFTKPRLFLVSVLTIISIALAVVIVLFHGGLGQLLHESEKLEFARSELSGLAAQGTAELKERARAMRLREELGAQVFRMAEGFFAQAGDLTETEIAAIKETHGPLIRKLRLGGEESCATIRLLAGAQRIEIEAAALAEGQGLSLDDPQNRRAVENAAAAAIEPRFQELLGQNGYAEYLKYESTVDWRSRLRPLAERLERVDEPLGEAQTEKLLEVLASVEPASRGESGDLSSIPDHVVDEAATILSPRQLQVLKLLQAEQRWSRTMSAVEKRTEFQVPVVSGNRSG